MLHGCVLNTLENTHKALYPHMFWLKIKLSDIVHIYIETLSFTHTFFAEQRLGVRVTRS